MTSQFDFGAVAAGHAANPRNIGALENADGRARLTGPCGDTMEIWLRIRAGRIEKASFQTTGCDASLACGSVATSLAAGKTLDETDAITQVSILEALGGLPEDMRHCARLAANTLAAACSDYLRRADSAAGQAAVPAGAHAAAPAANAHRAVEPPDRFAKIESRLRRVARKVVVLSGKGGVGKSTVAVNLAVSLALAGKRVGLMDIDVHGPSVPTMLGLEGLHPAFDGEDILPLETGGIKVISIGFFLGNRNDPVIWRGPRKAALVEQFIRDVAWGDLDCLVIDSPPGTGDEPLSVCRLMGGLDGALVVTTPQELAAVDVRKSIAFCRELGLAVLGVVENMSGFACPHCGEVTEIFRTGGGRAMAEEMGVPFLGALPIDPAIADAGDSGKAFVRTCAGSASAAAFRAVVAPILSLIPGPSDGGAAPAVPHTNQGKEESCV